MAMQYLFSRPETDFSSAIGSILRLVFWPIFVYKMAMTAITRLSPGTDRLLADELHTIRNELESIAAKRLGTSETFDLRFIFDRYIALADAVESREIDNGSTEFLKLAGHRQSELARLCLNRTMSQRLSSQFNNSQIDLAELLTSPGFGDDASVDEIVDQVSNLTSDTSLRKLVSDRRFANSVPQIDRLAA